MFVCIYMEQNNFFYSKHLLFHFRYMAICKSGLCAKVFTKMRTSIMVLAAWIFTGVISTPPLFGWARYSFITDQNFCFCNWPKSWTYTVFMVTCCFCMPVGVMATTNGLIFKQVRDSRIKVTGGKETASNSNSRREKNEIKLAKSMVVIILTFIASWFLFCIVMFIHVFSDHVVPPAVSMVSLLLGYGNSALNPIIYGAMNQNVKSA